MARFKIGQKNRNDMEKAVKYKLSFCKSFFESAPFTTKTYMALKTGVDMGFIIDNWAEITGEKLINPKQS